VQTELLENMFLRTWGEGEPILWIHGLGESSLCFEEIVAQSSLNDFQHWLLDLPGYGRSPWTEPMNLEGLARTLQPVLQRVGRTFVVGHSMGGALAVMMAEVFGSDRIKAVVNVEGNVSLGDCKYSSQVAGRSLEEFLESGHTRLLENLYRRGGEDKAHRGYFVSMRLAQPEMVYLHARNLVELSTQECLSDRMSDLHLPLLYLAGVPSGVCQRSLELLEDSALEVRRMEGCGHWPFVDKPAECARLIQEWLRTL
jgi:pimeloyl-ACP methyl ester carboxylesterase